MLPAPLPEVPVRVKPFCTNNVEFAALMFRMPSTVTPFRVPPEARKLPPSMASVPPLTHLIHRMAAIRWRVSRKALMALTELGVKAIQFT